MFNYKDNINLNVNVNDISLSIYANSDYEISENMKLCLGKLVHWFILNNLKLNIEKIKISPYSTQLL